MGVFVFHLFKKIIKTAALFAITLPIFAAIPEPLVVYSGRSESLVGPLFKQFEKDTGIKVQVRYNSTAAIAAQLLLEGKDSAADVVYLQDPGYLMLLKKANVLEKLDANLTNPANVRFRDPDNYWVGISARARVLTYNSALVKADELPKTLEGLADPKWKGRLGWAPSNASAQAHISALRHLWGEEKTESWLKKIITNQPRAFENNAALVKSVADGEIALGWTNHYYLLRLKQQNPNITAANYVFPIPGDGGNILMISGVGITKQTRHRVAAEQLIKFLLSEKAQTYLTQDGFEYPVRAGIAIRKEAMPLEQLNSATVQQAWLADIEPTLKLLHKLDLS